MDSRQGNREWRDGRVVPSSFVERNPVAWLSGRHDRGIGITLEHGMAVLSNPRRDKNRSINALYIRGLEYADGMRKLKGLPVKKKPVKICRRLPYITLAVKISDISRYLAPVSLYETYGIRGDERKRIEGRGRKAGTSEIRIGRRIESSRFSVCRFVIRAVIFLW